MITNSSDVPLTVAPTHHGAGNEFSGISRDEPQAMIQGLVLKSSAKSGSPVTLLEASFADPARNSDDLAAFDWIQRSLDGNEAVIIGLSEVNCHRTSTFQNPAPSAISLAAFCCGNRRAGRDKFSRNLTR